MKDDDALTPQEAKFLQVIAQDGCSPAQAARILWPGLKRPDEKGFRMWRKLRDKVDLQEMLEMQGLGVPRLASKINQLLEAEKTVVARNGEVLTAPDNQTQVAATKILKDILVAGQGGGRHGGPLVNINVNSERGKARDEMRLLARDHPEIAEEIRKKLRQEYEKELLERENADHPETAIEADWEEADDAAN